MYHLYTSALRCDFAWSYSLNSHGQGQCGTSVHSSTKTACILLVESTVLVLVVEVERLFRCPADNLVSVAAIIQKEHPSEHPTRAVTSTRTTKKLSVSQCAITTVFQAGPVVLAMGQLHRHQHKTGKYAAPLDEQFLFHPECFQVLHHNVHARNASMHTSHAKYLQPWQGVNDSPEALEGGSSLSHGHL